MIHKIAHARSSPLSAINRGLIRARHIQPHIKEMAAGGSMPTEGHLWSPMNVPYQVPITRWIE